MPRVASPRQRSSCRFLARVLPGAKPAPFPSFIEPCLATLRTKVPSGSRYAHELKLDGYRLQAHLHDGRVMLYTRSGLDWTARFPTIAADIARLPAGKLVLDGEVISADAKGHPSFSALQDDLKRRHYDRMVYYAFDLLHLDGFDTRAAPLLKRKHVLQSFLDEAVSSLVIYSAHFEDGADLYARACRMELEGVVSKRIDAPYHSDRTEDWIKVKCWADGPLPGRRLRTWRGRHLRLAPRPAGGPRAHLCRQGRHRFQSQIGHRCSTPVRTSCREAVAIDQADPEAGHWVEPKFEVEITYGHITGDGLVRHPSFKRLIT